MEGNGLGGTRDLRRLKAVPIRQPYSGEIMPDEFPFHPIRAFTIQGRNWLGISYRSDRESALRKCLLPLIPKRGVKDFGVYECHFRALMCQPFLHMDQAHAVID